VNRLSQLLLDAVLSAAGSRPIRNIEGPLKLLLRVQGMGPYACGPAGRSKGSAAIAASLQQLD